ALLGDDETLAHYQRLRYPNFRGGQRFAAPLEALGIAYYRLRDLF
ncbi:FAD-dependent oxidoreductase, partial [Pseudomonas aeruginosa]